MLVLIIIVHVATLEAKHVALADLDGGCEDIMTPDDTHNQVSKV